MPASAKCAEDLEQKLQISEASLSEKQKGSYASAAMAFSGSPRNSLVEAARKRDPVAVEQPKLISPALLAKTAPGDLKHVLGGNVKASCFLEINCDRNSIALQPAVILRKLIVFIFYLSGQRLLQQREIIFKTGY
jgi:hypothetical protein